MKKLFSASLVLLLMCATMSFSAPTSNEIIEVEASERCENVAFNVMHQALNMDISVAEATNYMNVAYALCEGYTMQDVVDAYSGPAGN